MAGTICPCHSNFRRISLRNFCPDSADSGSGCSGAADSDSGSGSADSGSADSDAAGSGCSGSADSGCSWFSSYRMFGCLSKIFVKCRLGSVNALKMRCLISLHKRCAGMQRKYQRTL